MVRSRSVLEALTWFAAATILGGCADTPTVYYRSAEDRAASPAYVLAPPCEAPCRPIAVAPPCAAPVAVAPCAPAAPAPCAPPPCAPKPCGLPCERGENEWHVRALAGIPFQVGTDHGHGCFYWGADVGTTRCSCIGFDAFYRTMSCDDERVSAIGPGTSPTAAGPIAASYDRDGFGKDGGRWQWIGLKATYEKSFGSSNLYGWVGAGPEYFWTTDYLDDDSGFGGFVEAGIGWKFASWGALRLGVDLHGESTSVTRKAVANSGESRFLLTVVPAIGLEIDF